MTRLIYLLLGMCFLGWLMFALSCSEETTYMPDSRPDCFNTGLELTIELPGPTGKDEIAYEITWRIRMTENGPRCEVIEEPLTAVAIAFGNKVVSGIHATLKADSLTVVEWDFEPRSE